MWTPWKRVTRSRDSRDSVFELVPTYFYPILDLFCPMPASIATRGDVKLFKQRVKEFMFTRFPDASLKFFSARSRRWIENHAREHGLYDLTLNVVAQTDSRVLTGPFKGMILNYDALPVYSAPKFLGTYEKEITSFVEDAIACSPIRVLNVGTSDGYYAVGLARRLPHSIVFAAEADPKSLRATCLNAKLNEVGDRVVPVGILHSGEFQKYLSDRNSLIVMDCEGAEFKLLDPTNDPILKKTNMIVELHQAFGSIEELVDRFSGSHSVETVSARPRTDADLPRKVRDLVPPGAVNEHRGPQVWAYMKVR